MNKAEALEIVRNIYQTDKEKEALETLIPELKESEDEKVRKFLVNHVSEWIGCIEHDLKISSKDVESEEELAMFKAGLAYLEKKKEQPTDAKSKRVIKTARRVLNNWLDGTDCPDVSGDFAELEYAIREYDGEEKQKEQKPAEWSEEYRKEDLRTRFAFYTYKDEDSVLYLSNVFVEETSRNKGFGTKILQAAEMVAQTIGALTIRLKVKQNTPANDWYRRHGYGYLIFEDDYDWLEKNLEYLKPKQEWSETDKLHLNNAILIAKKEWGVNSYTARFLETLRDNYKKCNSHWKPSEEQMRFLLAVINEPNNAGSESCHIILNSLYHDLQNLH